MTQEAFPGDITDEAAPLLPTRSSRAAESQVDSSEERPDADTLAAVRDAILSDEISEELEAANSDSDLEA